VTHQKKIREVVETQRERERERERRKRKVGGGGVGALMEWMDRRSPLLLTL
jgi:hypothetical protein